MSDERMATGVIDAILVDALLGLGLDVDELLRLSHEGRRVFLAGAANDGRIEPAQIAQLRELGLLPDSI